MNRKIMYVVLAVLLAAVILLNRREVELVKQDNFEIVQISANGYELRSVLTFNNKNLLSSTIKSVDEKFYVNGELVSITHNQLDQGIPGMKETSLPMMVRFEGGAFMHPNGDTLSIATSFNIEVKGDIEYSNFTGGGKIIVEQQGKANL